MRAAIDSAVINGRTFKLNDRVKCYFAKDPFHAKWYCGTVEAFVPAQYHHPKVLYEFSKSSGALEIVTPEDKHGWIVYKDYRFVFICIRTDERVDDREGRLFDGFGISYCLSGHVIFESEEEYDARPKITEGSIDDDELPF